MALIERQGPAHGMVRWQGVHSPSSIDDDSALVLVVEDAERTRSWIAGRYFYIRWIEADILYQSPPQIKTWEGSTIPRADIQKFTVATHVQAIQSKLVSGLFFEEPPFKLRPVPGVSENTTRSISAVLGYQLNEMGFRQEIEYGIHSCLLNGTAIWKWGWKDYYKNEVEYAPVEEPLTVIDPLTGKPTEVSTPQSDKFKKRIIRVLHSHPYLENIDIRHVLPDPGTRTPDIRSAKFVCHEMAVTYKDLARWADEEYMDESGKVQKRYKLPSKEEIKSWFEPPMEPVASPATIAESYASNTNFILHAAPRFARTTLDPLNEPLELIERWDEDKVITVLNKVKVIRNELNPFGKLPFFSLVFWMIQDTFWGLGLGVTVGSEQRLQQGFLNAIADIGTLVSSQSLVVARGANVQPQQIRTRLGGLVVVDVPQGFGDVRRVLAPMEIPQIPDSFFALIQSSEARAEQISGANELLTMGSMPAKGRTSIGRTATGAGALMAASETRLGGLIEDFHRNVYQPFLWEMFEMNKSYLPPDIYRKILSEELAEEYRANIKEFLTSKIHGFDVLAGSHLQIKQQMAQSMPLIMQYTSNPALLEQLAQINEEYVDVGELIHMLTDVGGWNNYYTIIKKFTPEMKRKMALKQSGMVDFQQKMALNAQKARDKQELSEQQFTQTGTREIIAAALRGAGEQQAVTGEPGGAGLGGTEIPG